MGSLGLGTGAFSLKCSLLLGAGPKEPVLLRLVQSWGASQLQTRFTAVLSLRWLRTQGLNAEA